MGTGSKEDEPKAFEVGRDGDKIAGFYTGKDSRRNWASSSEEAALELKAIKQKEGTNFLDLQLQREPAKPKRKWLPLAIIAGALVLPFLGLAAYRAYEASRPRRAGGLIMIDSVPSGAELFIDGRDVGKTPYVAPNTFSPDTTVPMRITYPGAQDYSGTFPGGVNTTITAELQAKPE